MTEERSPQSSGAQTRRERRKAERERRRAREQAEAEELTAAQKVWEQVGPILLAVAIALAIRAVIIESYYVPSGSMLPTMFIGDHVFVSKFTYGAKVPFTEWRLPAVRDPERGEIAVFELGRSPGGNVICPIDQCPDGSDSPGFSADGFVKRIIALPGDTVAFRAGQLFVNGVPAELSELEETFTDDDGVEHRVLVEEFDGCRHQVLDRPGKQGPSRAEFTVPADRYFVLGDNRDNSNDSRIWGTVHRSNLKGPVLFNYWAWNNQYSWAQMANPINWLKLLWGEMYWERFGMTYDCRDHGAQAPAAVPEP